MAVGAASRGETDVLRRHAACDPRGRSLATSAGLAARSQELGGHKGSETSEGGSEAGRPPQLRPSGGLTFESETTKTAQLSRYGLRGGSEGGGSESDRTAYDSTTEICSHTPTRGSLAVRKPVLRWPHPWEPHCQPPPLCPTYWPPWSRRLPPTCLQLVDTADADVAVEPQHHLVVINGTRRPAALAPSSLSFAAWMNSGRP